MGIKDDPAWVLAYTKAPALDAKPAAPWPLVYWLIGTGGGALPSNRLIRMCRRMGSHFHDWIDYIIRVNRMGSQIFGIWGMGKFR